MVALQALAIEGKWETLYHHRAPTQQLELTLPAWAERPVDAGGKHVPLLYLDPELTGDGGGHFSEADTTGGGPYPMWRETKILPGQVNRIHRFPIQVALREIDHLKGDLFKEFRMDDGRQSFVDSLKNHPVPIIFLHKNETAKTPLDTPRVRSTGFVQCLAASAWLFEGSEGWQIAVCLLYSKDKGTDGIFRDRRWRT